jgi:hypothetical protein
MSQLFSKWYLALALLLLVLQISAALAEPIVIESKPGNVVFSHKTHSQSGCVECHHETTTTERIVSCRQCHKKQSKGNMASQHAFHKNCIDCHAELKKQKKPTGPVKLCSQCHISKGRQ